MSPDDLIKRPLQYRDVQVLPQTRCDRDVVDGTPWRHPIKNPESLLRERQR